MDRLHEKKQKLEEYLRELGSAAIAFSSGVDSTFLLAAAHDVLGENAAAFTAKSCLFPARELDQAVQFCRDRGIRHVIVESGEFSIDGFSHNPPDRCYLCKKDLFTKFIQTAAGLGFKYVAEGSNLDDEGDYRPGLMAVAELNVKSPLREAGLTKEDIRSLSREMGLLTWDKPSFACLASRFVYGETISEEKLSMVDKAEQWLLDRGFCQMRVRVHDRLARVEMDPSEFEKIIDPETVRQFSQYLHELGFLYVTLDLDGYQTGSMNKMLKGI